MYLSHGHSVGGRADAVIDVGFSPAGVAGYASGEISGVLGSINTPSPLAEVFGLGSAGDYLLESVYWLNRADFEEFSAVWLNNIRYVLGDISVVPGGGAFLRRIVDYPTGLATAQVNINFERVDDSFYFNDGATEVVASGLYQKTDNGQDVIIYDRVPTESVRHRDQIGPPLVAPNKAGLLDTDDLGRLWAAAGQVFRVLTPPTGDSEVMSLADLGPQYVPDPAGYADLQDRGGVGAWYAERYTHNLVQIQGPALSDLVLVLTFIDVFTWLVANVAGYNTADFLFLRDETTFLGAYGSEGDALQELQFVLGGHPFPDMATHQYIYTDVHQQGIGHSRFRRVTSFVPGQVQRRDDFHWVGPHATVAYVDESMRDAGQQVLDEIDDNAIQSTAELNTHAGDPNAHHVPTPPGGGGLDPAAAQALIDTHAGMPNVHHIPGAGGITISADDPQPVGAVATHGTTGDVQDAGHAHKLPTDNTLKFNASDELAVNVTDVIDRLNETVEYYSNETGNEYDDGGHASMGEDYDTSAHRHIIHKVQIDINGADTSNGFWRAGVFAIDAAGTITAVLGRSNTEGIDVDQRHTFAFPVDVEVPASQRIRILGTRVDNDGESGSGTRSAHLSRGDEDAASPRESYDDAHSDFVRIRHVRANTSFPDVGDTTHDHAADSVRGDIKIWYTLKIDHGNLVGNGRVNAAHLDSGSAALGDVATAQGDGTVLYAPPAAGPAGGGGGPNKVVSQIVTGTAPTSVNRADSGLSGAITPSSVAKKVLIQIAGRGTLHRRGTADDYALALQRGGVDILVPAGLRARNFVGHISLTYLDSPASDAELTYGLFWGAVQGSLGASATSPMVMILEEVD